MLRYACQWITPNEIMVVRNLSVLSRKELRPDLEKYATNRKRLHCLDISIFHLNALHPFNSKRNIYNAEHLATKFYFVANKKRLKIVNVNAFRHRIEEWFGSSGIKKLCVEDLKNLIIFAENKHHLRKAAEIIRIFFELEQRVKEHDRNTIVSSYLKMCNKLNEVEIGQNFWHQSHIEINKRRTWTIIFYYTFLYDNGKYNDIIEDYNTMSIKEKINYEPASLVVLAALGRIETKEALDQMCDILSKQILTNALGQVSIGLKSRSHAFCSWVAYKLKEYDRAYDLLISKSDLPSHRLNSKVCSNMTLAIQIETRKLEEATISFRALLNRDSHNSQQKPSICFDIVKMYSDAIKKLDNQELTKEAFRICQELITKGYLTDSNLEEIVFETIGIRSKKDQLRPKRVNPTNNIRYF